SVDLAKGRIDVDVDQALLLFQGILQCPDGLQDCVRRTPSDCLHTLLSPLRVWVGCQARYPLLRSACQALRNFVKRLKKFFATKLVARAILIHAVPGGTL